MSVYLKKLGFSGQLLLALLVLTFSLGIASPVLANDNGPHAWATGDFEWDYPACPHYPEHLWGHKIIHLKVPRDGNPAEISGWIYNYNATYDSWIIAIPMKKVEWPSGVTPIPLLKVFDEPTWWLVGCPPDNLVWVWGKVVVGAFRIVSSSDRSKVGMYIYAYGLDGGPGGSDYFHILPPTDTKHDTIIIYYPNYFGFAGPPIFSNVIDGDLVIE
jgi:hypothetical protein